MITVNEENNMAKSYEEAGVNLEAGYEVVRRIKSHVASTARLGTMGNIGAFGGMFDLSKLAVKEPVLVSGTDGVGTKLKLAFEMDKHDTIGIDAVAMSTTSRASRAALSSVRSSSTPRKWPWATLWSAYRRAACTPTDSASCAR